MTPDEINDLESREVKKEIVITMREVLEACQLTPLNKLDQIVCPFHSEKSQRSNYDAR